MRTIKIDFDDMSGGKNTAFPRHAIDKNQVTESINAILERKGFSRAPGYVGISPITYVPPSVDFGWVDMFSNVDLPYVFYYSQPLQMIDRSSGALSWLWDDGNGNTYTNQNPTFSFPEPVPSGTGSKEYTITLTIQTDEGPLTTSKSIWVRGDCSIDFPPPLLWYDGNPPTVDFSGQENDGIWEGTEQYAWNSFDFDGASGIIAETYDDTLKPDYHGKFKVVCSIVPSTVSDPNPQFLMSIGRITNSDYRLAMYIKNDQIYIGSRSSGFWPPDIWEKATTDANLAIGDTYDLEWEYDNGVSTVKVNGGAKTLDDTSTKYIDEYLTYIGLIIGCRYVNSTPSFRGDFFTGRMYNVKFFKDFS